MSNLSRLFFVALSILFKPTSGSHIYSSIAEIRQLYHQSNLSSNDKDLTNPVQCFSVLKELFSNKLIEKNDLLGAMAGLTKIKNHLHADSDLQMNDRKLMEKVGTMMEEMDLERKSGIDYDLEKICDESSNSRIKKSNLNCFIDIKNFFLKKEILSLNPAISIVYEVYNDKEISNIIKEAQKNKLMHMFEIYEDYLDDLEVESTHYTHVYAGINFTNKDFLKLAQTLHFGREGKLYFPEIGSKESALIETKLIKYGLIKKEENKTVANLQISTYGIGGHLTPHYDTYRQPGEGKIEMGEEWMGTIMGYLTTIENGQGGETVFPRLGLSVAPVAGSVLVWNNINKYNGEVLLESLHAGCPVKNGEKWVFNKSVIAK